MQRSHNAIQLTGLSQDDLAQLPMHALQEFDLLGRHLSPRIRLVENRADQSASPKNGHPYDGAGLLASSGSATWVGGSVGSRVDHPGLGTSEVLQER